MSNVLVDAKIVAPNLLHFPSTDDARCHYCGLMKQSWEREPWCIARTSHAHPFLAGSYSRDEAERERAKTEEPMCGRCGMFVSQWGVYPKCPIATAESRFDTVRV